MCGGADTNGDKGIVLKLNLVRQMKDARKKVCIIIIFLIPGIFPNVISPMGAIFYTCVLL